MEVFANETLKPFEDLCPRIQDLVAEADSSSKAFFFAGLLHLMPDTLREIQTPGLPHCSRRLFFYTIRAIRVQEDVYQVLPS